MKFFKNLLNCSLVENFYNVNKTNVYDHDKECKRIFSLWNEGCESCGMMSCRFIYIFLLFSESLDYVKFMFSP